MLYFFLHTADSSYMMTTLTVKIEAASGTLKLAGLIGYATVWMILCFSRM